MPFALLPLALLPLARLLCSNREVIERFGRFPDRNAVLGRKPTKEEKQYVRRSSK